MRAFLLFGLVLPLAACTYSDRNMLAVDICEDVASCRVTAEGDYYGTPQEQAMREPGADRNPF